MKILICDDDREIAKAIGTYLTSEGYDYIIAGNGKEAVEFVDDGDIDLVIMDVMMPVMDGITSVMKIRESHNLPVIMLTAKSEDYDKVVGLNMGADDYVTKPFNPLELMARVKSQLRRYNQLGGHDGAENKNGVITIGGLEIHNDEKQVIVDGQPVNLTPKEYNILLMLAEKAGVVFTSDQIYERVWDDIPLSSENTVAVHIRRIREKIEIDPKNPRYLKVVWGLGYKVEKR